jgi:hypothetical protein
MSLKIENAEQLQTLISGTTNGIENIEELRDLLVELGQDPAQRKEELERKERIQKEELSHKERLMKEELSHKERLQERRQAHIERLRDVEQSERLRALELGQPLPDPGESERTRSAIRAAATIGILVPLVLATAAAGVSFRILEFTVLPREVSVFGVTTDLQAALFAMVWGVCGLITLITVLACLWAARRERRWHPPQERHTPARQPLREERSSVAVEQAP